MGDEENSELIRMIVRTKNRSVLSSPVSGLTGVEQRGKTV